MATHTLNKASTTTWEINETGSTWILGEKGSITGTDIIGIHAGNSIDEATIRVDGDIDLNGMSSRGVFLESQQGDITVSDTGHVLAGMVALYYSNDIGSVTIDNAGFLTGGGYGIAALAKQGMAEITNTGRIKLSDIGISEAGAGAVIINSGVIKADVVGIRVAAGTNDSNPDWADNATHIINTGKITGVDFSIDVYDGDPVAVNIRNKGVLNGDVLLRDGEDVVNTRGGTINGGIDLGGGNDVLDGRRATIGGIIHGGLGNDIVTLASPAQVFFEDVGQGNDTVRINSTYLLGENIENLVLLGKGNHTGIGNVHANSLTGNKGANILYGFEGGDMLDGGKGNDLLFGGNDLDVFVFKAGYGKDTIGDFQDGLDKIDITAWAIGDLSELDSKKSQVGDNVVIAFSDTDTLVIRHMLAANITADDFNF